MHLEISGDVDNRIRFEFNEELYDEFLSTPAQAKASLLNQEVYKEVNQIVAKWIRIMNLVRYNR